MMTSDQRENRNFDHTTCKSEIPKDDQTKTELTDCVINAQNVDSFCGNQPNGDCTEYW